MRAAPRRGLPLRIFTTDAGETLRLNDPDARRLGLLAPEPAREPEVVQPDASPVDGRVGEVLTWAGDDPARLREAIDAERAGRQRPTLLAELERRLTDGR